MTATLTINGAHLTLDPLGAAYWPQHETLIVSDLHFEKGSAFAGKNVLLPPYDTRTTLKRIAALMKKYKPRIVVSLGDAFHDREAESRMHTVDAAQLEALTRAAHWLWVLGNHDPEPPARFAGVAHEEVDIANLVFRHEAKAGDPEGEISGHFHPCAKVVPEGHTLRRRCFLSDGHRLILPAIGAYTGGLNVLDPAYEGLFQARNAYLMGADGVYFFAEQSLVPDARVDRKAG